jgi:hypothetical protein
MNPIKGLVNSIVNGLEVSGEAYLVRFGQGCSC